MASIASTPSSNVVRANGNVQSTGWANSPRIEAEIAAWYNATSLQEEKTIVRRSTGLAVDHVVYAPLAVALVHSAWRKNVSGIVQAPMPLHRGVSKTV